MSPTGVPGLYESQVYGRGQKIMSMQGPKSGEEFLVYVNAGGGRFTHEQVAAMVTQLDDMYSREPLIERPILALGDLTYATDGKVPSGVAGMVAGELTQESKILKDQGYPTGNHIIYMNANPRTMEIMSEVPEGMLMPTYKPGDITYFVAHEYGHVRMKLGHDDALSLAMHYEDNDIRAGGSEGLSQYGRVNFAEAHAESWAHYVHSGYTDGGNPYVAKVAALMGWENRLTASAETKDKRDKPGKDFKVPEAFIDDLENGPSLKYADGEEPKRKHFKDVK